MFITELFYIIKLNKMGLQETLARYSLNFNWTPSRIAEMNTKTYGLRRDKAQLI